MVDYSKWDNLDLSDEEEADRGRPRVTKYKKGSTITLGPNGHHCTAPAPAPATAAAPVANAAARDYSSDYSKWDSLDASDSEEEREYYGDAEAEAAARAAAAMEVPRPSAGTKSSSAVGCDAGTTNGGRTER
jgi:hypothetical protein